MKAIKICMLLLFISLNNVFGQLPDIRLQDLNWKSVKVSDLKGENLTIVDFWASWCKPCMNAIPKLSSIASDYKDQGVAMIGINTDGPRNQAKVKPLVRSLDIQYPILLDPDQELSGEFSVSVLPTLLIFNKDGKLVYRHEGFSPGDEAKIRSEVDKLTAEMQ